ncbi:M1 family metallopeptidase [Candidatus Saccharibacteria bacterium]|nr:M1 family metallopeptidase [Candidatus Saccharibacteria bacterium]
MERLLEYFNPKHYDITLFLNRHSGEAKGHVKITGEPKGGTIKLHAKDLTIDRVKLQDEIVKFTHENDQIEIPYFPELKTATLEIDYHFTLNTNMEGAYLSSYEYEGEEETLISTQLESHYAREAFPCVDEPAAKATFSLIIEIPDQDDTVISNMPAKATVSLKSPADFLIKTAGAKDGKRVEFEETPRMSTYLLAFCIGRFQKKTTKNANNVEITTYCTLNHPVDSVDFANQIAARSLDYYDFLFGTKYPLKKLDQIAIPDFEAGAMENWGLVTYRESCLLVDKTTTLSAKQYVATVVAHELSHQWFGNLVTMEWWNDLWLNESFANIMEYIAVDALHPEYNIWREYFAGTCRLALLRDALPGIQAVRQDVKDPAEISALFDGAIVYAKGSRLMLMLLREMGSSSFFKGIKDYFKKYAYKNTTGDDLWSSLQPYAKFNVKEFMDAWISQPGFPVFTDEAQQRFLLNGDTDDTKWPLPEVKDDMSGHYLINLSGDEFQAALKNFDKLSLEQKIRLLMDRSLLAKTSLVSSASLLDLLPKFRDEESYAIWGILTSIITDLKVFFPYEDKDRKKFQKYVENLISPQLSRLGIKPKKGESDNDTKLRSIILGLAYYAEHQPTLKALDELYDADFTTLDPEIRVDILLATMDQTKEAVFEDYLAQYQTIDDPEIKDDLLFTITDAKKHSKELIALLDEPKIVKPQDHGYLFGFLMRNYFTKEKAKEWLFGHWTYVEEMVGDKSVDLYPRYFASSVRTAEEAEEFSSFFTPLAERNSAITRAINLAKVEIDSRLKLLSMDNEDVHKKLKNLQKST